MAKRSLPTTAQRTTGLLTESIADSFDGKQKVDAESGVIHDVKLCGLTSSRGYDYSSDGLKKAVRLYEGVKVYPDHPGKDQNGRSVREVTAVVCNPRFVEGDGIRGDLKVFKEAPSGRLLLEAAQDPDKSRAVGMSHNADPTWLAKDKPDIKTLNGRKTVMGISKVYSVDLVDNPATTNGLFESADMETVSVLDVLHRCFPVGAARKQCGKLLEDMGMTDAVMPAPPEEAGHEELVNDAFLTIVTAIWKDKGLDAKARIDKIKAAAAAEEKLLGGDEKPAASEGAAKEEDDKGEGEAQESEDSADDKKDGDKKEGRRIKVGRLMEAAKKYKVDDAAILEEAALLPEPRAIKLLESFGRSRLAESETPRSTGRSAKLNEVVPQGWDNFKKHLREGLASEETAFLIEAN